MRSVFVTALVVTFVCLSLVADRSARVQHIITGTVTEWLPGEAIAIANEQTHPGGIPISLRNHTVYQGDIDTIKSGDRVTIWYRSVGERRPVADKVLMLGGTH